MQPKQKTNFYGKPHLGDEMYTFKENVEYILDVYLSKYDFTNKTIYCPCDSEESNFVKVFKERKDQLKYKELIYTSDDFRNHKDIFERADIVITNPPFSIIAEFLNYMKHDYFVFASMWSAYNKHSFNFTYPDTVKENRFYHKDLGEKRCPIIYIHNLTNIVEHKGHFELADKFKPQQMVEWRGIQIPLFRMVKNIPKNYDGIFAAPVCLKNTFYDNYFDIIEEFVKFGSKTKMVGKLKVANPTIPDKTE